jgi:hypothetical protein
MSSVCCSLSADGFLNTQPMRDSIAGHTAVFVPLCCCAGCLLLRPRPGDAWVDCRSVGPSGRPIPGEVGAVDATALRWGHMLRSDQSLQVDCMVLWCAGSVRSVAAERHFTCSRHSPPAVAPRSRFASAPICPAHALLHLPASCTSAPPAPVLCDNKKLPGPGLLVRASSWWLLCSSPDAVFPVLHLTRDAPCTCTPPAPVLCDDNRNIAGLLVRASSWWLRRTLCSSHWWRAGCTSSCPASSSQVGSPQAADGSMNMMQLGAGVDGREG